jgi:PmbA protein
MDGGCFNAAFDDEGVPTVHREFVSEGILRGFMHNSYSVARIGSGVAGNAFRSSFRGIPAPGPTNLFVLPGPQTEEELVESVGRGIYIQDVMGVHTADPISGDFSLGINGFEIRGGEKGGAVCEMTISGNILSLLDGITATGGTVRFSGRTGSPAVLVDGLSVSGR